MSIIKKTVSDNYGNYNLECIGIVDHIVMRKILDAHNFVKWISDFHPKHIFGSHMQITLSKIDHPDPIFSGFGRSAIFVPSEDVNQDWDCSFWREKHNLGNRKKKLPIMTSNESIKKWQSKNLLDSNIVMPQYFIDAKTITDLQAELFNNHVPLNVSDNDYYFDDLINPVK